MITVTRKKRTHAVNLTRWLNRQYRRHYDAEYQPDYAHGMWTVVLRPRD